MRKGTDVVVILNLETGKDYHLLNSPLSGRRSSHTLETRLTGRAGDLFEQVKQKG